MKTALILAAGRGERLKPLTDLIPKALCTICDIPIIEYHIANLASAGFERVVINHAYLGGKIRQQVGNGSRWGIEIRYAPEPPGGLETGGGIVNALPLLGEGPFVTVNGDIFTDYNFVNLHVPSDGFAHLVLVNKPAYSQHADFGLSKTNQLSQVNKIYTFSGIACYRRELFNHRNPGRYSMAPILRELAANHQASAEVYQGTWFDIGSLERLDQARDALEPLNARKEASSQKRASSTGCGA